MKSHDLPAFSLLILLAPIRSAADVLTHAQKLPTLPGNASIHHRMSDFLVLSTDLLNTMWGFGHGPHDSIESFRLVPGRLPNM